MTASTASNKWGVIAIASVFFDIDAGQSLEMLYPSSAALSSESKKSIAYLSLPHSNKQVEGDTQFSFRFRHDQDNVSQLQTEALASSSSSSSFMFLYGFVLFRQRKDESLNRGYFQKSIVVITELPFITLFDRVLRIVGPLYFEVGHSALEALYKNIATWYTIF